MQISGKTNNIGYAHANDGGADLRSNEDTIICAGSQTLVHTGVTLETSITGFLEHVDDIRHIIPSRDFFTISKTSMGYVPTVYYQCFIEPDDSCSETDKLLHLKVRIKPDVAHNGRIVRLYPEESEQAAIDDANRAIGRLRTILGRC